MNSSDRQQARVQPSDFTACWRPTLNTFQCRGRHRGQTTALQKQLALLLLITGRAGNHRGSPNCTSLQLSRSSALNAFPDKRTIGRFGLGKAFPKLTKRDLSLISTTPSAPKECHQRIWAAKIPPPPRFVLHGNAVLSPEPCFACSAPRFILSAAAETAPGLLASLQFGTNSGTVQAWPLPYHKRHPST